MPSIPLAHTWPSTSALSGPQARQIEEEETQERERRQPLKVFLSLGWRRGANEPAMVQHGHVAVVAGRQQEESRLRALPILAMLAEPVHRPAKAPK